MIVFDTSYLIAMLRPDSAIPTDDQEKPVEKFKERIEELIQTLNAADTLVGVPTPAIAELLVRFSESKAEYINVLKDSYRFVIVPFGVKAAIEASDLIATIGAEQKAQGAEHWAKIKFDLQITAIAKAESAKMLYADDRKIVSYAKRLNIPVTRIYELPPPKEKKAATVGMENSGQGILGLESLPKEESC